MPAIFSQPYDWGQSSEYCHIALAKNIFSLPKEHFKENMSYRNDSIQDLPNSNLHLISAQNLQKNAAQGSTTES